MFPQLFCHVIGDYFLQSDWMALNKSKKTLPCLIHCLIYTSVFLFLTTNFWQLGLIFLSHFVLDRWSLAKYICWIKNFLNPSFKFYPFEKCKITGYYDSFINDASEPDVRPAFITIWLYIITDNTLHLMCNYFILGYI